MIDPQRDFYEAGYGSKPGTAENVIAGMERLLPTERSRRAADLLHGTTGRFLDVGCGSGSLIYLLRGQFSDLAGVDIANVQLDRVRTWSSKLKLQPELYRANLDREKIPLPDASVDAAACIVLLEFVVEPETVLREIARVLRPGGILVASVGNIASWKNRLRLLLGFDPRTTTFRNALNGGALHYFTQQTFHETLERTGFSVEKTACSGRCWRVRKYWPALLGGDILVRARRRPKQ